MRPGSNASIGIEGPFRGTLCPLTLADLNELWLLDLAVFTDGEAYERETFRHLLSNPRCIGRQVRRSGDEMVAFAIGIVEDGGVGHITTLGVAAQHRRRNLARIMLLSIEQAFVARGVTTVRLEVRTDNESAQHLYEQMGYVITQRMKRYYSTGDDGYLMVKAIDGKGMGF